MNVKKASALAAAALLLGGAPAGDAQEKSGAPARDANAVVIEVNEKKITLKDIEERLKLLAPAVRIRIRENKGRFLDGLVQGELLYQEAIRRRMDASPEIRRKVESLRRRLVIERLLNRGLEKEEASERQLRDFFLANRGRFRRKESVTLGHIVLKTEQEAWDAVAELRRGVPFAQVARRRSIFESTRDSGGVMGTAERGALEKALEEAAFRLPVGQPSEPIKTSAGWQVIRVTDRVGASDAEFEDVESDVKLLYSELRRREKYEALIRKLREAAKVEVHAERFR